MRAETLQATAELLMLHRDTLRIIYDQPRCYGGHATYQSNQMHIFWGVPIELQRFLDSGIQLVEYLNCAVMRSLGTRFAFR